MINSIAELEARFGESAVAGFIKSFSCPLNSEVEDFLKKKGHPVLTAFGIANISRHR